MLRKTSKRPTTLVDMPIRDVNDAEAKQDAFLNAIASQMEDQTLVIDSEWIEKPPHFQSKDILGMLVDRSYGEGMFRWKDSDGSATAFNTGSGHSGFALVVVKPGGILQPIGNTKVKYLRRKT